jgi:hypothetical protein
VGALLGALAAGERAGGDRLNLPIDLVRRTHRILRDLSDSDATSGLRDVARSQAVLLATALTVDAA